MIPPDIEKDVASVILDQLLAEEDPELLRGVILELVMSTGFWYRRASIHKLLHPLFYLGDFYLVIFHVVV